MLFVVCKIHRVEPNSNQSSQPILHKSK
jgi:hypothetical protein